MPGEAQVKAAWSLTDTAFDDSEPFLTITGTPSEWRSDKGKAFINRAISDASRLGVRAIISPHPPTDGLTQETIRGNNQDQESP